MTLLKMYAYLLRRNWYVLVIGFPVAFLMGLAMLEVYGDGWLTWVVNAAIGFAVALIGLEINERRLAAREWDRKLREAQAQWERMLDNDEPRDY